MTIASQYLSPPSHIFFYFIFLSLLNYYKYSGRKLKVVFQLFCRVTSRLPFQNTVNSKCSYQNDVGKETEFG